MIQIRSDRFEPLLRAGTLPPKLFIFSDCPVIGPFPIEENGVSIGQVQYRKNDIREALIEVSFADGLDLNRMHHGFGTAVNDLIRRCHPAVIYSFSEDPRMNAVYPKNLFFPKGAVYKRLVEPWRYQVNDSCFDQEGYIINQGGMTALPFGLFNTREKGCGWIAVYNLLKLNGMEQSMQETAETLSKFDLFGEVFGENFFKLWIYLQRHGLQVKMALGKKAVKAAMRRSKNGILLYSHKQGAHFCSYRMRHDGTVCIYNAVYGKQGHHTTIDAFFDTHVHGIKVMLLYVC